jgi:hypothetical protein
VAALTGPAYHVGADEPGAAEDDDPERLGRRAREVEAQGRDGRGRPSGFDEFASGIGHVRVFRCKRGYSRPSSITRPQSWQGMLPRSTGAFG